MKLVVGLGNPGKEYEKTRHNTGFIFLNSFLSKEGLSLDKKKFKGLYTDFVTKSGNKAILLEPQTFMNLSGDSIIEVMNFFKIDKEDILIIYDDLDLPIGKLRIRSRGSSGGHNGIKSIINQIGSEDFKRVRIGIDKDPMIPIIDYVLGKFSLEGMKLLESNFDKVHDLIIDFIDGIDFHVIESKYN